MAKKQSGGRRGRPPGAKNKDYAVVEATAPRCKACGSTKLSPNKGAAPRVLRFSGRTVGGHDYDTIKWQRSTCEACGQSTDVKTFHQENNTAGIISK